MWIRSQLTDCYAKKELTTGLVYTEIINETTELAALISLLRTVAGHFVVIFKIFLLVNYFALHNGFAYNEWRELFVILTTSLFCDKSIALKPHLQAQKKSARHAKFLAPCFVYLGGSLGTPKILSIGAILFLGPIRLHVENWECRARFLSACKWGLNVQFCLEFNWFGFCFSQLFCPSI